MRVYCIVIHYGLDYEGDYFEILGIFDSKEKAEKVIIEYENSQEYRCKLDMWDYFEIDIVGYNINSYESFK